MSKDKSIIKLFEKARNVGPNSNLLKLLKNKFKRMKWQEFNELFTCAFMSIIVAKTTIHCVTINNMIKFAANGIFMLTDQSTADNYSGKYLISEIFKLCRTYGRANDKAARWRFCLFFNYFLNSTGDGIELSEEMCTVATIFLLERLNDNKSEVRAQAAYALNRLQLPNDSKCPIVIKFIFHMTHDPVAEVRTTIVKVIAMFNNVIDEMLKSTILDISDSVRKEMFNRFLTYPFLNLSSKQRQIILDKGLNDGNTNIKSLVKKRLIVYWLKECNDDILVFLEKLGVENELLCEKTLNTIFESYFDSQILDLMNKYLNSDSRMIDFDKLTVENIFLWKCVAKYLTTEKKIKLASYDGHIDDSYVEILLPDLVNFSNYIREFYFTYNSKENNEFIMIQLLDVAKTFRFDEVGAASLNKLCFDIILDNSTSIKPIRSIAVLLNFTIKSGQGILQFVKQILNDIQERTMDLYPLIDKVGRKEILKHQITSKTKKIEELSLNESLNSEDSNILKFEINEMNKEYQKIKLSPQEEVLVNTAVNNLHKGFELVFQVQQLPKVNLHLSLLTDIIQNIIVGFLKCSMVKLRMEAIHSLAPYLLNNVTAAKQHIITLCGEIANPLTNRHLIFDIMFKLLLRYDLKTFDMNIDLDILVDEDNFSINSVLPMLVNAIDYTFDDSSFKSVVVKGFCQLLLYEKVKSINLLSKLLIIWNKRVTHETFNIYNYVVRFITSYSFFIRSSSTLFAKCYVPLLMHIDEHDLLEKLNIKLCDVNSTILNLTRGIMYENEKEAINAHNELAGYILDYLLDENQPFTTALVDTLCKLDINFNNIDELVKTLRPKLTRVIKHFKNMDDKSNNKYLKKINNKFDPVLNKKKEIIEKNDKKKLDNTEMQNELPVPSCSTQESNSVVHGDLFSDEHVVVHNSDEENEDIQAFTKLEEMKRMSEIFKNNFKEKTPEKTINNSSIDD